MTDFKMLNVDQERCFTDVLERQRLFDGIGNARYRKNYVNRVACALIAKPWKRVLLSSFTNSAVDNMLLKLRNAGVDFVRIGNEASVHPQIRMFTPKNISKVQVLLAKKEEAR